MSKKKYIKDIKSVFNSVEDIKDLIVCLKLCTDDDLLLISCFCEIILEDRKFGEE